jgi:DNA (cytosine-5)-methyltransferase 1
MLKMLDLFSGIGGFSLAASWTGAIETVAFCEIEPYCQKVLHKHWPDTPIYSDIKELNGYEVVREHGSVDIVCGGFPCQPFSCAGKQRGKEDDRYLWPEMFRVIQETKPTWVIGENVANFVNMGLDDCVLDLEGEGYEVQPFIIPAAGVGAPHLRYRVWIVGFFPDTCGIGRHQRTKRLPQNTGTHEKRGTRPFGTVIKLFDDIAWKERASQSGFLGRNDGIPNRVDRIKGLGNAIVPQVVYPIFQAIVEIERRTVQC